MLSLQWLDWGGDMEVLKVNMHRNLFHRPYCATWLSYCCRFHFTSSASFPLTRQADPKVFLQGSDGLPHQVSLWSSGRLAPSDSVRSCVVVPFEFSQKLQRYDSSSLLCMSSPRPFQQPSPGPVPIPSRSCVWASHLWFIGTSRCSELACQVSVASLFWVPLGPVWLSERSPCPGLFSFHHSPRSHR